MTTMIYTLNIIHDEIIVFKEFSSRFIEDDTIIDFDNHINDHIQWYLDKCYFPDDIMDKLNDDLRKMSDAGITEEELELYPAKLHEVLGGDITADPLPLSDEDYLGIYERSFK